MAESRAYVPPIEQLFDARLEEARAHLYDCLNYDDKQCYGRLVLLTWIGGKELEDHPRCTIREHDRRWLHIEARNDEPRLIALRFRAECRKRCLRFAGPKADGKHSWHGVLFAPTSYGKVAGCNFGRDRECVKRVDNPPYAQDLVEVRVEFELQGDRRPQQTVMAFSMRIE